jgi:hypothetical protein
MNNVSYKGSAMEKTQYGITELITLYSNHRVLSMDRNRPQIRSPGMPRDGSSRLHDWMQNEILTLPDPNGLIVTVLFVGRHGSICLFLLPCALCLSRDEQSDSVIWQRTPCHPDSDTPRVEVTTGPLDRAIHMRSVWLSPRNIWRLAIIKKL